MYLYFGVDTARSGKRRQSSNKVHWFSVRIRVICYYSYISLLSLSHETYLNTPEQGVAERYVSASDDEENVFQHIAFAFGFCVLLIVVLFMRTVCIVMMDIVARDCCGMCMTLCTARCCQDNSSTSSANVKLKLSREAPTVAVDMDLHQELSGGLLVY